MTWALYPLLTTALVYLGGFALITKPLWSRYPRWLDTFMTCASCQGTWWGFLVGLLGWWRRWAFMGLPGRSVLTVVIVGLCSMVWTPILLRLQVHGLQDTNPHLADLKTDSKNEIPVQKLFEDE